MIMLCFSLC